MKFSTPNAQAKPSQPEQQKGYAAAKDLTFFYGLKAYQGKHLAISIKFSPHASGVETSSNSSRAKLLVLRPVALPL